MPDKLLSRINEQAKTAPATLIAEAEASYHDKVAYVAERVCADGTRVILLAGPSGSGKTTTANLIADAIRAKGHTSIVVSLDDFYRDTTSPQYPKLPDGRPDYESAWALDLPALAECIRQILSGEPFRIPRYDFKVGRADPAATRRLDPMTDGCVIIEGLHALNPEITAHLPQSGILKMFVSVSTNLCGEGGRLLSGRKLRFLRRLVRDRLYRGTDAARTLKIWQNVLDGEDKYLYPYKETADLAFDTFHPFEPGVMRDYALEALDCDLPQSEYIRIVLHALSQIEPIDPALVPQNSLIREFIPGGIYEHLY